MTALGNHVIILEPESEWSIDNLYTETLGEHSLATFTETYSDLHIETYAADDTEEVWCERLRDIDVAILHEWNTPEMSQRLIRVREKLGHQLLFHDTHHRASSSPGQIENFGLRYFDGVLAFGDSLSTIYRHAFGIEHVWTLHEAADTTVFHPVIGKRKNIDVVWIGNWGEGERSEEIKEYLLRPAATLSADALFKIYGVRYPQVGLDALCAAHVRYGGYLPNLDAPAVYGSAKLTVHIPRQQYTSAMIGIPTIRVFEALACGIPLISEPWQDIEHLFSLVISAW